MGIRQILNENRSITMGVAALAIVVGTVVAFRGGFTSQDELGSPGVAKQFYSIDDGQHWFVDDSSKIPPFQHEGKPAYRATVFRCVTDGKEFVSHLERYGDADRQRMEDLASKKSGAGAPPTPVEHLQLIQAIEVKKPGDANWIKQGPQTTEQYQKAKQPKCPSNAAHHTQPVLPK